MSDFVTYIEQAISGNPLVAIFLVYFAGVLTSFTPCMYPMIPITVGYIGARSEKGRLHGFFLSLCYVFGMALTYTVLGIFAALTGRLFGAVSTHPVTYGIVAIVVAILGLHMLGVFEIRIPVLHMKNVHSKSGWFGALLIGFIAGLILSPCTAPVLFILLGFVATTRQAFYGGLLMFLFAFGMGTLLILVGTFAGFVKTLPKSGEWMNTIKKIFGVIMLVFAVYLVVKLF